MRDSSTHLLTILKHGCQFAKALEQTVDQPAQRAALLAELVHECWPSDLSACMLYQQSRTFTYALDQKAQPRPEWIEPLRDVLELTSREWKATEPVAVKPPSALELTGCRLIVTPIRYRERVFGFLALAGAENGETPETEDVLFVRAAEHLALLMMLEISDGFQQSLREAEALPTLQNCFSDLAYIVAHEFNNILNNMMLQLAVLEHAGDSPKTVNELAPMRQLGNRAASMIRRFQQLGRADRPVLLPVDLNQLVRQVTATRIAQALKSAGDAASSASAAPPLHLELSSDLPLVSGTDVDLKRLLLLLLDSVHSGNSARALTVRTEVAEGHALLCVHDDGPPIAPEKLPHLFEPFAGMGESECNWQLAVCRSIARRLQGTIWAENREQEGTMLIVKLRFASRDLLAM